MSQVHGFTMRGRLQRDGFALDLDVTSRGRSLGVFGPSGAGKSTLLEAVAGWIPFDGEITVGGRTLSGMRPEARGIGYVPQDLLLFPHRTVMENLRAGAGRSQGADVIPEILATLELERHVDRRPEDLSGGERQRVSIGRALASGPDLLLLDEPLGSLDRALRRRVLPYILRVRERFAVPIVLVSHDPAEVHALCDDVVVLDAGRVLRQGSPADVLSGPDLIGADFENVLSGTVASLEPGIAVVRLAGGATLRIPGEEVGTSADDAPGATQVGESVLVGLRAEDILLATGDIPGLSARNAEPATVVSLTSRGGAVHVLLRAGNQDGPLVWSRVTPGAVEELSLAPGTPVRLVIKTRAALRLA
jgi:molybdate transport system ATP-binding protein